MFIGTTFAESRRAPREAGGVTKIAVPSRIATITACASLFFRRSQSQGLREARFDQRRSREIRQRISIDVL
jgi:hypothetical protein